MNISEVMTRGAECTRPGATLREAAQQMKRLDVGPLPVCGEDDKLVGILTDRDIAIRAVAEGKDPNTTRVQDVMTDGICYCFDDQSTEEAVQKMEEAQVRRLVVLSRDKKLVGIVSLGDIAVKTGDERLSGQALEEVSEPAAPRR